jgi:hypothetical protein
MYHASFLAEHSLLDKLWRMQLPIHFDRDCEIQDVPASGESVESPLVDSFPMYLVSGMDDLPEGSVSLESTNANPPAFLGYVE